jgi:hypothetical protein
VRFAAEPERSKGVKPMLPLMGAGGAALRCCSQGGYSGGLFKSARQGGSSVGLRVFAT